MAIEITFWIEILIVFATGFYFGYNVGKDKE